MFLASKQVKSTFGLKMSNNNWLYIIFEHVQVSGRNIGAMETYVSGAQNYLK